LRKLYDLIQENNQHSILIFTDDNKTAYRIGETFALPVITHHTKAKERKEFLENFKSGEYPILVSSKVLNEGVDVPEANVGIILSGSGSQREHVQRLGRILRKVKNKNAVLYELISKGTSEKWQSRRRREHSAYSQ
jgi:superfamily II DNA or RNA helicase